MSTGTLTILKGLGTMLWGLDKIHYITYLNFMELLKQKVITLAHMLWKVIQVMITRNTQV